MTDETIVAIFDTAAHAAAAVQDLRSAGVPESVINVHANGDVATDTTIRPVREEGFWASLFGGQPDDNTTIYDHSVDNGSTIVTVKTSEERAAMVMDLLDRHNPIDIDERATGVGLASSVTAEAGPALPTTSIARDTIAPMGGTTSGDTIQLSEESLVVGKRLVNRGGTRIRRFVVETPVEESVSLRNETVRVERRPITDGRPVADADFTDKTIEMTETGEEAVVGKTARVVEEVSLRKEAVDRTETIHETVRKEDVEIEQIPGEPLTSSTPVPVIPPKPTTSNI
jgi:uncharacterized protein (TIGR02271 family)